MGLFTYTDESKLYAQAVDNDDPDGRSRIEVVEHEDGMYTLKVYWLDGKVFEYSGTVYQIAMKLDNVINWW